MKIKKLSLKNIRSYEFEEIIFPEGSLLLSGDVGSGKTSILLAIEYALFGLQPGQTGSALLRNNTDIAEVILEMQIEDKDIKIERKLKRGSKSINNDFAAITVNGKRSECSITELKSRVLKLLGYPSELIKKTNLLYRYTIYTPQEQMKQIITEDPETRLNILRYIFGIDKYKTIRENLQILMNKIKDESKVLQGEIKDLDKEKENLSSQNIRIQSLEMKIKETLVILSQKTIEKDLVEKEAKELELKIKEKDKLETEIEKTKIFWSSKKEQLNILQQDILSLTKSLSESGPSFKEEEMVILLNKINQVKLEIEGHQAEHIQVSSQLSSLEQKMNENIIKRERIFKIDTCPTCLQNVPYAHKHNITHEAEKEITEIKKTLILLEKKMKENFSILESKKTGIVDLEKQKLHLEIFKSKTSELEKTKRKLDELNKTKAILDKDIEILEKHLSQLKENTLAFSKFSNLHRLKIEELKRAAAEEKKIEILLAENKKELELTEKEKSHIEILIKNKEEKKENLSNLLELSDWLSNNFFNMINFIEKQVMIKLRLEFSKLFSKWFYMIAGDVFEVQLDESFTPLIRQGETEMEYSFLSGGERTAIALAYRLALNQTINSLISQIKTKDIIILDEPTEGFSEAQIEKIRDVLSEIRTNQLIIVSHEQKIEGFVDKTIRLKKEGESSYLEKRDVSISSQISPIRAEKP